MHRTGYDNSYGNYIVVKSSDNKYHWFCHLSKINVSTGKKVSRTTIIGIMGNTGNSSGKHLHFEIRNASNRYADTINPADYMGIPNKVGSYNSNNNNNNNNETKEKLYRSHVQDIGWQDYVGPGIISGTVGKSKRIEAIQINSKDVQYRVHMQDKGWGSWRTGNQIAGTIGEARRIEAIQFKSSKQVTAQGHVQNIGWQPVKVGKNITIGTTGKSLRLEAFAFRFV